MDDLHANDPSNSAYAAPSDVLPFSLGRGNTQPAARTDAPRIAGTVPKHTPVPRGVAPHLAEDSIQNAEAALAHVDRRLANLRKLLGETSPDEGPRAA